MTLPCSKIFTGAGCRASVMKGSVDSTGGGSTPAPTYGLELTVRAIH